jgi:SAM-dependent methyltransferase
MDRLLLAAEERGWRQAIQDVAPELQQNVSGADRAAFEDILPVSGRKMILDLGAGLGAIATRLAEQHQVVALEGVRERANFLATRKRQDGLDYLTVINGELNKTRFAPGQFDVIVVNGVLEWAALFDLGGSPEEVQARFLHNLRKLLTPEGYLYIGIENRFGWSQLRGALDHSGLRYTSLLPRWLASEVCARSVNYRSNANLGYRTYTYSHRGYRQLFQRAGLAIATTWIAPHGYNLPNELIPLNRHAISRYVRTRLSPPVDWRVTVRNWFKSRMAAEWFWRYFGSDYVFVLQRRDA